MKRIEYTKLEAILMDALDSGYYGEDCIYLEDGSLSTAAAVEVCIKALAAAGVVDVVDSRSAHTGAAGS